MMSRYCAIEIGFMSLGLDSVVNSGQEGLEFNLVWVLI